MRELNVAGTVKYDGKPNLWCPPGRIVAVRAENEDPEDRFIISAESCFRPDLAKVVGVGEPVRAVMRGNRWYPEYDKGVEVPMPELGDTVLVDHTAGQAIIFADFGDDAPPFETRVYGQGIPIDAVSYRQVGLTPWWDYVMAEVKDGEIVKAYGDNVYVLGDTIQDQVGSVLLPETLKQDRGTGTVLAVGPLAEKLGIEKGMRICFGIDQSKVLKGVGDESTRLFIMRPESIHYAILE